LRHDKSHRSKVANIINQNVAARDVNKIKPRNLQIQLTVADKSVVTPDNTRDVKPDKIAIIPATEDARNIITQGFERSDR
jgi:hypothetical protein